MARAFNFAAGPAILPEPVLKRAAEEMLDYGSTGMSVMEMSHRSKDYLAIYNQAEAAIRSLMNIPETYAVLFLQGGASGQFAGVAMNLLNNSADYVDSGNFAAGAMKEASKYGAVRCVASSKADNYTYVPEISSDNLDANADYLHITTNNTIFGTRYTTLPESGNVPLVADMSSNILSEPYDVTKFGVIYAGAQKNIGPAGVTVVIVRRDLLGRARKTTPKIFDWAVQAENQSMINTPCTYGIYIAKLCFEWLISQGGVPAIYEINKHKAGLLYKALDELPFYTSVAQPEYRSLMNVTFRCKTPELDDAFVKQAAKQGMTSLKGHRLTGGIRASIYNAMPVEGVQALVKFMKEFAHENA